jgi:hypothetical protein
MKEHDFAIKPTLARFTSESNVDDYGSSPVILPQLKYFKALRCIAVAVLMSLASHSSFAFAEAPLYGIQLKEILQKLTNSVPAAQSEQIIGALNASPSLGRQLDRLASEGRLTAITIAEKIPTTKGLQFGGTIVATSIYFSSSFLARLQNNHLFDVRNVDDLSANNTVFALGDLAYLISTDAEMAAAIKTLDKNAFIRKAMTRKAVALIQGWNDVVDAATGTNGGKTPTPGQIGGLLLNMRYRAVFLHALKETAGPLVISDSGMIERNDSNVAALISILSNMAITDLE